jgi:murein L,D-transpeptidase YcbB/YkuD
MSSKHLFLTRFAIAGLIAGWALGPVAHAQTGQVVVANLDTPQSSTALAAAEPKSFLGFAIKDRLADGRLKDLNAFYAARAYEPFWLGVAGERPTTALLNALEAAGTHALPAAVYGADTLRSLLASLRVMEGEARLAAEAELEFALSRAMALYGGDLASGYLEPRKVDSELNVFPVRPSAEAILTGAASAADFSAYLAGLAPREPGYEALRARFAAFQTLVIGGDWSGRVPEGASIKPGARGPRVAALRDRLTAIGDIGADGAPRTNLLAAAAAETTPAAGAAVYDDNLVEAVKAFQRRHGLNDDGVVGRRTVEALNATASQRLRQIAVNLERMRWLNRDLGTRRIVVNQADFRMQLIDNGEVLHSSRVVVGKSRKFRTPEFSDEMTHVVVNPVWNVPNSIATKEILPLLKEDPSYLLENNMMLVPRGGEPVPENPELHDWSSYSQYDFPFLVKQRPGGDNALGRVKFIFPNQFSIYLHDTPSKSLFRKDARAFSHGCVRVENPFDLAYALLAPDYADPVGRFSAWLDARSERWVGLREPVPVHLTYRTAWVDDLGVDQFREDIYGRDAKVFAAMVSKGLSTPGA